MLKKIEVIYLRYILQAAHSFFVKYIEGCAHSEYFMELKKIIS